MFEWNVRASAGDQEGPKEAVHGVSVVFSQGRSSL